MDANIEAMIKATIQTKVIEAFNTTPDMVEKLIASAFNKEVDDNGRPADYHSRNKQSYLDWLVGDEIRKAGQDAVREYVANHAPAIRAKVIASIDQGEFGSKIGEQIAKMMEDEWRWSFSVQKD